MHPARQEIPTEAAAQERDRAGARAVVAATVGNALEFYDFLTYGFFAI